MKNPVQPNGVLVEPFNPIAVAIAVDAPFVARANVSDAKHTKEIIKEAIAFRGFSMVDIFAPCVVFNKVNTYKWFTEHAYKVSDDYDPTDRAEAFRAALETERLPIGVLYRNDSRELYEDRLGITETPLHERTVDVDAFREMLSEYR